MEIHFWQSLAPWLSLWPGGNSTGAYLKFKDISTKVTPFSSSRSIDRLRCGKTALAA